MPHTRQNLLKQLRHQLRRGSKRWRHWLCKYHLSVLSFLSMFTWLFVYSYFFFMLQQQLWPFGPQDPCVRLFELALDWCALLEAIRTSTGTRAYAWHFSFVWSFFSHSQSSWYFVNLNILWLQQLKIEWIGRHAIVPLSRPPCQWCFFISFYNRTLVQHSSFCRIFFVNVDISKILHSGFDFSMQK